MTNEAMVAAVKFEGEHAGTLLAKQLFMHDKKKKENMWLVCAAVDTVIDLKALNKHLPCGSGNLRAADGECLEKYLRCRKGMVNYFSIVNDTANAVTVIMDQRLLDAPFASFHPMDNSASTCIPASGILKLKELTNRDDTTFQVMDFSTLGGAAAPEGGAAAQKPAKPKPNKEAKKNKEEKKTEEKKPAK